MAARNLSPPRKTGQPKGAAEPPTVPCFTRRERRGLRKPLYQNMVRAVRAWLYVEFPDRRHPSGCDVDMIAILVEEPSGTGHTISAFHAVPGMAVAHDCRTSANSRKRKDCVYCRGDRMAIGGAK